MSALQLPSLPTWETAHPVVVHFPVALLLVAGLPLLVGLVWSSKRTTLLCVACGSLLLGVIGAFIAVSTGEAGEDAALNMTDAAHKVLHEHEELAERARNLFIGVTLLAGIATGVSWKFSKGTKKGLAIVASALVLIAHGASSLVLANAAHAGGRLVHEFGVRAPLGTSHASADAAETDSD